MGMMRGDCRTEPPKFTAVPITAKDWEGEGVLAGWFFDGVRWCCFGGWF
jgi:hypothetical protein